MIESAADCGAALQTALAHHRAGRLGPAEQIYRQILQRQPDQPDALHLLGVLAHQHGRNGPAIELISKAIEQRPDEANFHGNLGNALKALGRD